MCDLTWAGVWLKDSMGDKQKYLLSFLSYWQHADLEVSFNKQSRKPQGFGPNRLREGSKALLQAPVSLMNHVNTEVVPPTQKGIILSGFIQLFHNFKD